VHIRNIQKEKKLLTLGLFLYNDPLLVRYRLYCQGIICWFMSRYLATEAMAFDVPCLPIGPLRCVFSLGTVSFAVVLLCSCLSPSCPGCIHLVVASFGSFFCSSAGFESWSILEDAKVVAHLLSGSFSDRTCTWIA